MSLWLTIPIGAGIIAAFTAVTRRSRAKGIYVGLIESCLVMGTDPDCLQVRAYVDETLVRELPAPSKLTCRMFIRETNMSVPLMFVRVPPYVSLKIQQSDEWQERADVPVQAIRYPRRGDGVTRNPDGIAVAVGRGGVKEGVK